MTVGLLSFAAIVPGVGAFSQRSILNINDFAFGTFDYAMINHVLPNGVSATGVNGLAFVSSTTFPAAIDANGWPSVTVSDGLGWDLFAYIPDMSNFGGPYIMDWQGNGQIDLHFFQNNANPPTITAGTLVNCTAINSNFSYLNTAGSTSASATFSISGGWLPTGPTIVTLTISQTNNSSNGFLKNIRLYRQSDQTDLNAGKIWRTGWKQPIVNLCPAAIRFMNLHGGNNCRINRFENRALPTLGYYDSGNSASNWLASPSYPKAVAGGNGNQYTVGTAVPTTGNPKTTPASMVHGEIATVFHPTGIQRATNYTNGMNIANVTNASPGVVTTGVIISSISYSSATGLVTVNAAPTGKFSNPGISVKSSITSFNITGVSPSGYNGAVTGTVTGAYTFTYPVSSNPGAATVSSGYAQFPHGFNTGDQIIHFMYNKSNIAALLSSGSNVLINVQPDASVLSTGAVIFGPGIPAGTTISSLTGTFNGTITLSAGSSQITVGTSNINVASYGMYNLHLFPTTITVLSTYTYSIQSASGGSSNIDTTNFGPFIGGSAEQYVSLQVGSGNNRIAYPCVFADSLTPASFFGDYIGNNAYKTWYFDKAISAISDGAGNAVTGAWMFSVTPNQQSIGAGMDFPIEAGVALINELNAMGPAHTIGMYWNAPAWGLSAVDPDYSSNSDWMVNAVDVIMNPNSTARSSGYAALGYSGANSSVQVNQPNLYIEYSNEFWSGTNDAPSWASNRSNQRWGTGHIPYSYQDMKSLRQVQWARSVTATSGAWLPRTKYLMGLWNDVGMSSGGDFGGNYNQAFGGAVKPIPTITGDFYTNDTLVTTGGWGTPISNLHGMVSAPYLDPASSYTGTSSGTGTFTDDSAMFNGVNNSSNGGGNYTGAANQSQAITNFVASIKSGPDGSDHFLSTQLTQFSSFMTPIGKMVAQYEGGNNWEAKLNGNLGGHTLTQADNTFSIAVINSSQYGALQTNFFNSFCAISSQCFMPSMYTWIGAGTSSNPVQRWAQTSPDAYGATGIEGGGLTAISGNVWNSLGARNQALTP